ncbi:MAG: [Fe-S]-binding protein [Promethearchaeia archaeon]|nr:MAG: [Fe-S]-binding protein [Candidatus Lokiarchaeia archaeon]
MPNSPKKSPLISSSKSSLKSSLLAGLNKLEQKEKTNYLRNLNNFPQLFRIRQKFDHPTISAEQIPTAIDTQLNILHFNEKIKPGETVAITAGSRGIAHISLILKTLVKHFQRIGAQPFIFPAMGSHGGGTLAGQLQILQNYGITEAVLGCPIKATMEVDLIATTSLGTPVYLDRFAAQADHIFVVNRVKPHTKFSGKVESGLMKMCLIGMGKCKGAQIYHRAAERYTWDRVVTTVYEVLNNKIPLLGGLALLENAYDEIALIQALSSDEIPLKEPELLKQAYLWFPRIPFPEVDLLIVDEIGKEYSGTGMDTIVVGKKPSAPIKVKLLYVRDLTEQTHGNAQGIGFADFTRRSLVEKIDFKATYLNSQTAFRTQAPKIPMTLANDREVIRIALQMSGYEEDLHQIRLVWIKNTLELEEMVVSEAYRKQVENNPNLEILSFKLKMDFTEDGFLILKDNH